MPWVDVKKRGQGFAKDRVYHVTSPTKRTADAGTNNISVEFKKIGRVHPGWQLGLKEICGNAEEDGPREKVTPRGRNGKSTERGVGKGLTQRKNAGRYDGGRVNATGGGGAGEDRRKGAGVK